MRAVSSVVIRGPATPQASRNALQISSAALPSFEPPAKLGPNILSLQPQQSVTRPQHVTKPYLVKDSDLQASEERLRGRVALKRPEKVPATP